MKRLNQTEPGITKNPLKRITASLKSWKRKHAERHQPSGFGFLLADRIDFVDSAKWDAVVAGQSVFLRRDVLRVIESAGPENIEPKYAMVFRDGQPAAAIAMQMVEVSGEQLGKAKPDGSLQRPKPLLKRVFTQASRVAQDRLRERVLVAGNLLSWGFHGIALAPGENLAELWSGITEALYRVRRAERLSGQTGLMMIKDLSLDHARTDLLGRYRYQPLETEPNMVLTVDPAWRHYDDYLTALDARYRRNAKDQLKKLAASDCQLERLPDIAPHAARIHQLYLSVQQNASVRLVTIPANYLPALAKALGDDFKCTVVRRGENLLGFVSTVRDGDTATAYYIGFDREMAATGLPLYLRLLHSTVSDAIQWGCRRLSLGRTALEPKAALGAKPEPMTVWLRHRVPAINWLVRGVMGAVPHAEAPERNPFKSLPNAPLI